MKHTDEQLTQQFLSGNEKALKTLIERYLSPIYNFTYRMVQDKEAAEDITQDVFIKMWRKIASFDPQKKFSTWIFTIAKNTAYDFLKKKKSIPFSAFENEDGDNILEYIEDITILHSYELLQKMDNAKEVQELLMSLPMQTQTILWLHHNYGFSLIEIAEIPGHRPNTIKSQYRRAILQLRKTISLKKSAPKSSSVA